MHRRCEALLYMAARSQLVEEQIRPALEAGKIVVCDRFLLANVVYQSVSGGESAETLWQLGVIATGGLVPDLTLVLDIPAEQAMARIDRPADRMESRGVAYMEAVRQGFLREVEHVGGRHAVVDATRGLEEVADRVWFEVTGVLGKVRK